MKISSSEKKLNNKGFSLMELIVVLAIMIVMVGAATVTVSMLDSSYVEDAERGIKDYIALARTKSMSVAAKDWYVSISKEDADYYVSLYKIVEKEVEDAGVVTSITEEYLVEKKKLGAKISISYGSKVDEDDEAITWSDISNGDKVNLHFDPATGKVNSVFHNVASVSVSSGIGYINITRNDYKINLKVFYNTGKCERE